jgi:hypothetical protein
MQLVVHADGTIHCLYDETLDLNSLGTCVAKRASFVEPDEHGSWSADLGPAHGPMLGPFALRSEALAAEQAWLEKHIFV